MNSRQMFSQVQNLRCVTSKDSNQHSVASVRQSARPPGTTQRLCNIWPENDPEYSTIVRDALRMNLPDHLVLRNVERRFQTQGSNYTNMTELVSDLFTPKDKPVENQEVPMETNQLEEALMMNSHVVKKALRKGVPPHLIKPKVRAKILCNRVGYTDINELLTDLSIK